MPVDFEYGVYENWYRDVGQFLPERDLLAFPDVMPDGSPPVRSNEIDPDWFHRSPTMVERLLSSFDQGSDTECWTWTERLTPAGYGAFPCDLRAFGQPSLSLPAHRVVFVYFNDKDIPPGWVCDHICKNTMCVNPSHIRVVTPRFNTLIGDGFSAVNARKTECPYGHDITDDTNNTEWGKRVGGRQCLECCRERTRQKGVLICQAMTIKGLPQIEYIQTYGRRRGVALKIIKDAGQEVWTEVPESSTCPNGHERTEENTDPVYGCRDCTRVTLDERSVLLKLAPKVMGLTRKAYRAKYGVGSVMARRLIAEHGNDNGTAVA